jgi:hypothetical protein
MATQYIVIRRVVGDDTPSPVALFDGVSDSTEVWRIEDTGLRIEEARALESDLRAQGARICVLEDRRRRRLGISR